MSDCYCYPCGYTGTEDDFVRDDADDLIDALQEAFDSGMIGESSYENMFDHLSAFRCPNCGEIDSVVFYGSGVIVDANHDLIQAEIDAEEAREMAEMSGDDVIIETTLEQDLSFVADSDATELLYQYGVIDEDEYHARMEFAEQYANY